MTRSRKPPRGRTSPRAIGSLLDDRGERPDTRPRLYAILVSMNIGVACEHCGQSFTTTEARRADGRGRYCSRACSIRAFHTGRPKPKSSENLRKARQAKAGLPAPNAVARVTLACQVCGKDFQRLPREVSRSRYCSRECSHQAKRNITGPGHPLFTRELRRCEFCGKEVWVKAAKLHEFRFCSRRCQGSWVNNTWPRTSSIEIALREALSRRSIAFAPEYSIGPYTVDIAMPDHRLAIEADGTYWHGTAHQQARDRQKDGYLHSVGWRVLRFTEVAIRANADACAAEIAAALVVPD